MSFSNNFLNYNKNIPFEFTISSYNSDSYRNKRTYINLKKPEFLENTKTYLDSYRKNETLSNYSINKHLLKTIEFSQEKSKEKSHSNINKTNKDLSIILISKKIKDKLSKNSLDKNFQTLSNISKKLNKKSFNTFRIKSDLPNINIKTKPKFTKKSKILNNPQSIMYPIFDTIDKINKQSSPKYNFKANLKLLHKEMSSAVIPAFKQVFMLKKDLGLDDNRKLSKNLYNSNNFIVNDKNI